MKMNWNLPIIGVILATAGVLYYAIDARLGAIETDIDTLQTDVREIRTSVGDVAARVEGLEVLAQAQNVMMLNHAHQGASGNGPTVVATEPDEQSEVVEILDYLDDTPRRVGRTLENAAEDAVEFLRSPF